MSLRASRLASLAYDRELLPKHPNAHRRHTLRRDEALGAGEEEDAQQLGKTQDPLFYECAVMPPAYETLEFMGPEWVRLLFRRQVYFWIEEEHIQDPAMFALDARVLTTGCGVCRALGKGYNRDHKWRECTESAVVSGAQFWCDYLRSITFVPPPNAHVPPEFCSACWWPIDLCESWKWFGKGRLRGEPGLSCQYKGLFEEAVAIILATESVDVEAWIGLLQQPRAHFNGTINFLKDWNRPKHAGWMSGDVANAHRLGQAFAGLGVIDLNEWGDDIITLVKNKDREKFIAWYCSCLEAFIAKGEDHNADI